MTLLPNGSYFIYVEVDVGDGVILKGETDMELSACVSETAVITETKSIEDCTGLLTAGIEADSGFVVESYAWTYTLSGGSP